MASSTPSQAKNAQLIAECPIGKTIKTGCAAVSVFTKYASTASIVQEVMSCRLRRPMTSVVILHLMKWHAQAVAMRSKASSGSVKKSHLLLGKAAKAHLVSTGHLSARSVWALESHFLHLHLGAKAHCYLTPSLSMQRSQK